MARIPMAKRITIAVMNIIFPPLAVLLLTNRLNEDVLLNSILFLLAVVPSHIHGFYVSLTYFNRKRKVRRGVYPGDRPSGIWSERITMGGASRKEYLRMRDERDFGKQQSKKLSWGSRGSSRVRNPGGETDGVAPVGLGADLNRSGSARPGVSRQLSNRIERWDDGFDAEAVSQQSSISDGVVATNRRPAAPDRRASGRSGHGYGHGDGERRQQASRSRSASRHGSRPQSLTRQLSNRLEDTVRRRLTEREDRRRRRGDETEYYRDNDDLDSYGDSTEVPHVQMAEVRRWR